MKKASRGYGYGYDAGALMADEMNGKKMATGGRVHSDAAQDKKIVKAMVKPSAMKKMAMGGKVRKGMATPSGAPKAAKVHGRGKAGIGCG